jgi:50S ribosomal protein L16 3-hydroxylase
MLPALLGYGDESTFFSEFFGQLPFAYRGAAVLAEFSISENIDRLLQDAGADIFIGRQDIGVWKGEQPNTFAECSRIMSKGYTVGIRHLQTFDPASKKLASDFAATFCGEVDVHLYGTSASEKGFGWHYDAEDVFILQIEGSKEWFFRKNTVNPWPLIETLPMDMAYQREITPTMSCILHPNDWLYLPVGYWHSTRAIANSFSLSVGVNRKSCIDIYDHLRSRLLNDIRWRQRLPADSHERPEQLKKLFESLGEELLRLFSCGNEVQRFLHK